MRRYTDCILLGIRIREGYHSDSSTEYLQCRFYVIIGQLKLKLKIVNLDRTKYHCNLNDFSMIFSDFFDDLKTLLEAAHLRNRQHKSSKNDLPFENFIEW